MRNCPKCNCEVESDATECKKCGIIFSKYEKFQAKQKADQYKLLTECKVCGRQISKRAEVCPKCGEPNDRKIANNVTSDKIIQYKRENPTNKSILKRRFTNLSIIHVIGIIVAILIVSIFIFGDRVPSESKIKSKITPNMPDDLRSAVISEIEDRDLVKDAYIGEKGETVYLAIQVAHNCNENYAKSLGDDFVRFYIALSPQEPNKAGKMIGKTQFDYHVGIGTSERNFIAQGYKVKNSPKITW